MANALDYAAAAIVEEMRLSPTADIDSIGVIQSIFKRVYHADLSQKEADGIARRLERFRFLRRISDHYAGTYFVSLKSLPVFTQITVVKKDQPLSQFVKALSGGRPFLVRVFKSEHFWPDFRKELELENGELNQFSSQDLEELVPASDRIVSISDNERSEILDSSAEVIAELTKENAIDGDVSLRDSVIGEMNALRELVRAQAVRVVLIQIYVSDVLNMIIQRYGEKTLGEVAKKLLERLIDYILVK
jgi:hypothetical protein